MEKFSKICSSKNITRNFLFNNSRSFTSVVSTASSGIGLEFCRQLLLREDNKVIALHRSKSDDLISLHNLNKERLHLLYVDLESQASIDAVSKEITAITNSKINLLLNVAGLLGSFFIVNLY